MQNPNSCNLCGGPILFSEAEISGKCLSCGHRTEESTSHWLDRQLFDVPPEFVPFVLEAIKPALDALNAPLDELTKAKVAAIAEAFFKTSPILARYRHLASLRETQVQVHQDSNLRKRVAFCIPDDFVIQRWNGYLRSFAESIKQLVNSKLTVQVTTSADSRSFRILENFGDRLAKISFPEEVQLRRLPQNFADFVRAVRAELFSAPTKKPPKNPLEYQADPRAAPGAVAQQKEGNKREEYQVAHMYDSQSHSYGGLRVIEKSSKFPLGDYP